MQTQPENVKTLEQIKQEFLNDRHITNDTNEINEINNFKNTVKVHALWEDLIFLLVKAALIALVFVLMFTFLFGIVRVQDPSMNPSIKDGDIGIFYRYTKSGYLPGDAIVLDIDGQRQIRRVIAVAGDTVDITEEGLIINGALQQEIGIYQNTNRYADGVNFPLTVPDEQVFVLGDNREYATDSRIYGCVKLKDTLGKIMTVIRRRSI